jgi:TonB family protein
MALLEKTNPQALLVAITFTLLTMILANPLPSAAQQETTPAPPPTAAPQTKTTPRPNPDTAGIYHAGDGVTMPRLINMATPEFSEMALRRKIVGCSITLGFIVDTDGQVRDVRILRSCGDDFKDKRDREAAQTLDHEALKAVSQYQFEPAKFHGRPVPFEFSAEVKFGIP